MINTEKLALMTSDWETIQQQLTT